MDEVSKILGLTGKPEGVDGSRVEEMVLAGQIEKVARYCESDVLNTYRVWLVYELFRGSITAKEHEWSEAQVRDFVASCKSAAPHLCKAVGVPEATTQNNSAAVSSLIEEFAWPAGTGRSVHLRYRPWIDHCDQGCSICLSHRHFICRFVRGAAV